MAKPTEITLDGITRVAERLNGTAASLDEVLEDELGVAFDDVPHDMLVELDCQVLLCEACGWWSEAHEFEDEHNQICNECAD